MRKIKFLFPLLVAPLLSGCFITDLFNKNSSTTEDNNYVDSGNHDIDPSGQASDSGSQNDFDSEESFDEKPIETPETFDGSNVTEITSAGNYYFSGECVPLSITKKDIEVYIFLDGASFSSNEGIAFGSSKAITLYLVLQNGSVNTITNDFLDTNAFHVKGEVHILGEGTLNIVSKQKSALKVSKDLYISGNVTINAEGANHAITARSITAEGVTINTKTYEGGKDGIQLECDDDQFTFSKEQGFANLKDVKYTSDTYGDGIQAESYIYISSGEYNITTHGVFVSYSSETKTTYELEDDDFKFVKSGSTYKRVAKDEIHSLSSSYYALANSVKGIKVSEIETDTNDDGVEEEIKTGDYEIYIAHGANITLNTTDDGVHANYGNVTLEDSNLVIDTFDDGVHVDYDLLVKNSVMKVITSYEALEGANVTVDGENTELVLYASDDGINAASDLTSTHNMYIKNGYLRVFANGDGLDANTAIYLQGGTTIVEGPGSGNGSLDADQIYFQGGIVFACSTSGMTERSTATQPTFRYQGSTISANTKVAIIESSSSESIFSYTLKQSCNQITFSHPDLVLNKSYKIVAGSTTLATITLSSNFTTYGSSQGGPGGGGPGGGGHW